jgi:hypothetical protein
MSCLIVFSERKNCKRYNRQHYEHFLQKMASIATHTDRSSLRQFGMAVVDSFTYIYFKAKVRYLRFLKIGGQPRTQANSSGSQYPGRSYTLVPAPAFLPTPRRHFPIRPANGYNCFTLSWRSSMARWSLLHSSFLPLNDKRCLHHGHCLTSGHFLGL